MLLYSSFLSFSFQEHTYQTVFKANNNINMLYMPLENVPDIFTIGYFVLERSAVSMVINNDFFWPFSPSFLDYIHLVESQLNR
jgi:hypothetical protein